MIVRGNSGGGDLRGYGSLFCHDLADALDVMNVALANADTAGVDPTDTNYALASQFYASQTGIFTKDWMDLGGACAQMVQQCKTLIDNLNASIAAKGGAQVPTDQIKPPATLVPDLTSSMSGWLIGGLVVVGLLGVAWLGSSVSKIYLAKKRLA